MPWEMEQWFNALNEAVAKVPQMQHIRSDIPEHWIELWESSQGKRGSKTDSGTLRSLLGGGKSDRKSDKEEHSIYTLPTPKLELSSEERRRSNTKGVQVNLGFLHTFEVSKDKIKQQKKARREKTQSRIETVRMKAPPKEMKPMFGVKLDDVTSYDELTGIPSVMYDAIQYLSHEDCMSLEGIFRKSGSKAAIDSWKRKYDDGEKVDLSQENDPHVVAGLLKQFLREMPDPMLPYDLYEDVVAATEIDSDDDRKNHYYEVLNKLPDLHYICLRALMRFLFQITKFSDQNKMTCSNVAIVISPNILKQRGADLLSAVLDSKRENQAVTDLLQWNEELFEDDYIDDEEVTK